MAENKKLITADNSFLTYMGRIDFSDKTRPEFYYAGSNVKMTFTGTSVSAVIKNHKYFNIQELGFVIDGKEGKVTFDKNDEDITLDIACDLEKGTHTVTLFKRQDASHYFEFVGFEIDSDGEVLENPPLPARKIECYGDSVSAGAVCEAVDFVASCDPEDHQGVYDNITRFQLRTETHVFDVTRKARRSRLAFPFWAINSFLVSYLNYASMIAFWFFIFAFDDSLLKRTPRLMIS